ncbi:MAG TPA: OsmC family protein [Rhizomicrobium sp.]|nr:OsmC family protein [Rhizomicrobium sp.]
MHEYKATIQWKNAGPDFLKGRYSREHSWTFDGGLTVAASSAPGIVPVPWSNPANVDPEEAFVASISSCHMLTFLWFAAKDGFQVVSYRDEAIGVLAKNERGAMWVSDVTLHPNIAWMGAKTPTPEDLDRLHHRAHEECFIANSVKTTIRVAAPQT